MKNVTITLEEEVARWARIRAAELDTSVSRLVGEMLRERMLEEESYDAAGQDYLARDAVRLKPADAQYPTRDQLHERTRLR
jgi:hypothetical protein